MKPTELYYKWDCNREHRLAFVLNEGDAAEWEKSLEDDFRRYLFNFESLPTGSILITCKSFGDVNTATYETELAMLMGQMFEVEVFQCDDNEMTIYLQKRQDS